MAGHCPKYQLCNKNILAKATTYAQISAIGHQTCDRVGFFLHTDDFSSAYLAMQTAAVTFEELPRDEPYG